MLKGMDFYRENSGVCRVQRGKAGAKGGGCVDSTWAVVVLFVRAVYVLKQCF